MRASRARGVPFAACPDNTGSILSGPLECPKSRNPLWLLPMQLPRYVRKRLETPRWQTIARLTSQQLWISLGTCIAAFGYVVFQLPYNLAAGGFSGLGIIVHHYIGLSPGLFYLLINIPLFVVGFFMLGRWRFIFSSALAVVLFSVATEYLAANTDVFFDHYPITQNRLLAAIFAGLVYGVGTGIIYRYGGTIGGNSIPARIIYNKTGFPLSQSYLFTDLAIILLSGAVFDWETALFALLTLLVIGLATDFTLEGSSQTRTLLIITADPDPIRCALIHEMQRGVTTWQVQGGFSGAERTMIYCTVLRSRIYDVKHIVSTLDPDAFMVVGVSKQTWGGYNAPRIDKR